MTTTNRTQTNGLLPVAAAQTSGNSAKQSSARAPSQKMKVIIRRLAPGLTEGEFAAVLGDEWRVGQGKVDWFQYKPGKVSKDPSKPSRPSRTYLHLTNEAHVMSLSEKIRLSVFEDAQNTFTNQCLVGPPAVEFAPYGRIPGSRVRQDARAGTIDQDPEFMAFLEGLANPITTKEGSGDASVDNAAAKPEKVTTTPLVQFLKEKKANKSKEAAVKAAKKQEAQLAKAKSAKEVSSATEDIKKKGKDGKPDKALEKASKEAVRILNREAATKAVAGASEPSGSGNGNAPKLDVAKVPGRQRGAVVAAHIRMLQRDLGLTPAQAHRQVRRDAADAQKAERAAAAEKANADSKQPAPTQPLQSQSVPTAPKANGRRPRGKGAPLETDPNKLSLATASSSATVSTPSTPVILLKKTENNAPSPATPSTSTPKSSTSSSNRKPPPSPAPSVGATQAFVKHANPSQGVTEGLLKEAMEKFGAVSVVEIDKRKGFAYVDFVDTEGLKKAMAANPISVAQGTVQVMQRKGTALPPEKKQPAHPTSHSGNRGGRGGGRGGASIGRRGGRGARGGNNAVSSSDATKAPTSVPTGPAAK